MVALGHEPLELESGPRARRRLFLLAFEPATALVLDKVQVDPKRGILLLCLIFS